MLPDIIISSAVAAFIGLLSGDFSLSFLLFGIVAGLSMDLDFLIWLSGNNWKIDEFSHEHRDYFHIPLLYTVLLSILWFFLLGPSWALVWFCASMFHFIHDTYSGGWGIRWLFPFSKGYWTRVRYSKKNFFKSKEEQREYAAKYGNPNWIEGEKKKKWQYILFGVTFLIILVLVYSVFGW